MFFKSTETRREYTVTGTGRLNNSRHKQGKDFNKIRHVKV